MGRQRAPGRHAPARPLGRGQGPGRDGELPRRQLLGIPADVVKRALPVIRPGVALQMRTPDETARACLEALPAQLDRVDALLAEGVIGGERPNAADFQIAPCVRLMLCFDQLRPHIDARPAGRHARALVPDYPGRFKAVIPGEWMPF